MTVALNGTCMSASVIWVEASMAQTNVAFAAVVGRFASAQLHLTPSLL